MTVRSFNTYNTLDEQVKLKRSQTVQNNTSSNLYATLMMTKEDGSKRESAKNSRIKDLLVSDSKEQLSESDKEKIWYTLDYLRIRWVDASVFSKLTAEDFSRIKSHKTASNRAEELVQVIIEKASDSLAVADKDKSEFKRDINDHVNAMMKWRNAEIGNNIAEDISLTKWTTRRVRYFGNKIKKIIDDHGGDISKCYKEVMKNANYAALPMRKRSITRYPVPIKFSWRDMNKQTENTLRLLEKKSEESDNQKEKLAINYIIKRLQEAYNCYKESIWVSNARFDSVQRSNEDRIYRAAA